MPGSCARGGSRLPQTAFLNPFPHELEVSAAEKVRYRNAKTLGVLLKCIELGLMLAPFEIGDHLLRQSRPSRKLRLTHFLGFPACSQTLTKRQCCCFGNRVCRSPVFLIEDRPDGG